MHDTRGLGPNFTEDNGMNIADAAVLVLDGKVLISDGRFAETKEQIGGYCLIDCKNLDEAIEVASQIPGERTVLVSRAGET
jgi:hypothetical protein